MRFVSQPYCDCNYQSVLANGWQGGAKTGVVTVWQVFLPPNLLIPALTLLNTLHFFPQKNSIVYYICGFWATKRCSTSLNKHTEVKPKFVIWTLGKVRSACSTYQIYQLWCWRRIWEAWTSQRSEIDAMVPKEGRTLRHCKEQAVLVCEPPHQGLIKGPL